MRVSRKHVLYCKMMSNDLMTHFTILRIELRKFDLLDEKIGNDLMTSLTIASFSITLHHRTLTCAIKLASGRKALSTGFWV